MIHEKALALAGPDAHLVSRPHGVLHLYIGPLTACAHVPRARKPLCRTRTRQLTAVTALPPSLAMTPGSSSCRRMCARCTARVTRDQRAVHHPTTRLGYQDTHASTTAHDLVFALQCAETPAEVDATAHLTLALFTHAATTVPHPNTGRSLLDEVRAARTRVHGWPQSVYESAQRFNDLSMAATEARKARAKAAREERAAAWEATRPSRSPRPSDPATTEGATTA